MIGDVGDIIIRGGNPLDPGVRPGRTPRAGGRIDHISFGISPWDTDGVKAELEKRGLTQSTRRAHRRRRQGADEIHVAPFKSYHTHTPNGYNLQISYITHDNRLALPTRSSRRPSAAAHSPAARHGSSTLTSSDRKSRVFLVTSVSLWTRAVAARRMSIAGAPPRPASGPTPPRHRHRHRAGGPRNSTSAFNHRSRSADCRASLARSCSMPCRSRPR